jgi:ribosome-associated toxin RatA of RatAB toxin-antitoxin module
MKVKTSLVMNVPPERAYDIYADYAGWPQVFPTISAVRLVSRAGNSVVLEVDHRTEGKVRNELVLQPKGQLELRESKRRYDARFINWFDPVNAGTQVSVTGDIRLKGFARLLAPLLGRYARRLIQRFTLQPIKIAAEAGMRSAQ